MNNNKLDLLSDRIEKLETRLGWWQLISFAALTCLVVFMTLHRVKLKNAVLRELQTKSSTTEEGRFTRLTIVDSKGAPRAILTAPPSGPQLSFINENETTGCALTLDRTYGASLVFKKSDTTRVSITSIPSALICADTEGSPRAIVAVSNDGDGVFSLTESDGTPIVFQRAPYLTPEKPFSEQSASQESTSQESTSELSIPQQLPAE
jgi:hypothetical protein